MLEHPYNLRITPTVIPVLLPMQIYTFASNVQGIHGIGTAKTALQFGAQFGQGEGFSGQTYALPTRTKKDKVIISLPLPTIQQNVFRYIEACVIRPEKQFLTIPIGCGHAGYKPHQIAPFFESAIDVSNICLPLSFWLILLN